MNPITDGYGTSATTPLFRKPLIQFDLDNEYAGFAAIPTMGVQFYLGNNTGLQHYWVDTTAVNGFRYFYAITSYDHGDPALGIDPSECTKFVAVQSSGEIEKGSNVIIVRPAAPSAGYRPADFKDARIASGVNNTADGSISYDIVDRDSIKNNHTYQLTFQEATNTSGYRSSTSFTLVDSTTADTLLANNSLAGDATEGLPVIDGFKLAFSGNADLLDYNADLSGWNATGVPTFTFRPFRYPTTSQYHTEAADYEVIMGEVGIDRSVPYRRGSSAADSLKAMNVNFTVINTITGQKVPFAFRERHIPTTADSGKFTFNLARRQSDEIYFLNDATPRFCTWQLYYSITSTTQADSFPAVPGNVLTLVLTKPFLSHDTYTFTTQQAAISQEQAKVDLDRIRVVPNPYIVTNSWEPENPYANGRGERQLHFTHLPSKCTIRIFNVRGQLVNTLEHQAALNDGTEIWDMLSRDNLEISYGIYIYHIKADGIGEKIGKFAVIK
jgi:hypothetical protein